MLEDKPEDAKIIKERFNKISKTFDGYERAFEGRLYRELEWERLLKLYLPEDKDARILDAGGGTGRMTLSLARLGYQVALCDISPGMLAVAKEKLEREGLLKRVEIKEAEIESLPFLNDTFDFVICFHGAFRTTQVAKELTRVMKRGGKIIVNVLSRYGVAVRELKKNPEATLKLLKSESNYAYDSHGDWMRIFSPEELKGLFEENGIVVMKIYGSFYELLPLEILERQEWNDKFLSQIVEILMCLREEPSVVGMAGELILVGKKR